MSNAILVLNPYVFKGQWVFDDETVGLKREPFVAGADDIIDEMVNEIPNADDGFIMLFSTEKFVGYQATMKKVGPEYGGTWYHCEELNMDGWLCPALFKYFPVAPEYIYAQAKPKEGI